MLYIIEIQYKNLKETIEIQTSDLEWTMGQYQRNRDPFSYKIIRASETWDLNKKEM